jgi:hypothetical protein
MNDKKLKLMVGSSLIFVLLLLGVYSFGDIKYSSNQGLSYDEKKRDVKYLMNFLETTYPYFDEIKAEGGQDFLRDKNKIITSIAKTTSDEEFYAKLSNLFLKIPYGDLRMTTNTYAPVGNFKYLDKTLNMDTEGFKTKLDKGRSKWEIIENKYVEDLYSSEVSTNIIAAYHDGDYFVVISQNPEIHVGDKVIAVDGIPVDEYAENAPTNKYIKFYDYTHEKHFLTALFPYEKKSPKEVTIRKTIGEEIKVKLSPMDTKKPYLENLYESNESFTYIEDSKSETGNFINYLDQGNTLALDFSKTEDLSTYFDGSIKKADLHSSINSSSNLILDLRFGFDERAVLSILNYISNKELEYSEYKVIKKNEISEEYIKAYENEHTITTTKVTSPIEALEKSYPLSKYHIYKDTLFHIEKEHGYKGKIFIFVNSSFVSDTFFKVFQSLIDNNIATVISDSNLLLPVPTESYFSRVCFILPNSNIAVMSTMMKTVDENGKFTLKKVVNPQIIVEKDKSNLLEYLKKELINMSEPKAEQQYNYNDDYYSEFLKSID